MSDEFQVFCKNMSGLINNFIEEPNVKSKFFVNNMSVLMSIYENPISYNFGSEFPENADLKLGIFLFKGDVEKSREFFRPERNYNSECRQYFLYAAVHSQKMELIEMIIDYVKNDYDIINYAEIVMTGNYFPAFKYFIDNTIFRDLDVYPERFYEYPAISLEIFQYILKTKPYDEEKISEMIRNIHFNNEIIPLENIKYLLTLTDVNTFEMEEQYKNDLEVFDEDTFEIFEITLEELLSKDFTDDDIKLRKALYFNCLEIEKVLQVNNDLYRISEDNDVNNEFRKISLPYFQKLDKLKKQLEQISHGQEAEEGFGSQVQRVMTDIYGRDIALLEKEIILIKNNFI